MCNIRILHDVMSSWIFRYSGHDWLVRFASIEAKPHPWKCILATTQATCLLLACKYDIQTLVLEIHFRLRLLQFVSCGTQGSVDESEKESDKTFCE